MESEQWMGAAEQKEEKITKKKIAKRDKDKQREGGQAKKRNCSKKEQDETTANKPRTANMNGKT